MYFEFRISGLVFFNAILMHMHIRIIYGSNSGSTRSAAELMSELLIKSGYKVTVQSALDAQPADIADSDVTIIGSCSWDRFEGTKRLEGQLHEHWFQLQKAAGAKTFPRHRFAVFGLGDSTYTHFCGAADHLEALVKKWKGVQIGTTLRLDSYFFEPERNAEQIRDWLKQLKPYLV